MPEKQQRISYQPPIPIVCTTWLALSPCGCSSRAARGSWILDFDFRSKPVPKAYPISDAGVAVSPAFFSSLFDEKSKDLPKVRLPIRFGNRKLMCYFLIILTTLPLALLKEKVPSGAHNVI